MILSDFIRFYPDIPSQQNRDESTPVRPMPCRAGGGGINSVKTYFFSVSAHLVFWFFFRPSNEKINENKGRFGNHWNQQDSFHSTVWLRSACKKDLNHVWSQKNLIIFFEWRGPMQTTTRTSVMARAHPRHTLEASRWSTKSVFAGFGVLKIPCMGNGVSLSSTVIL